AGVRRSAGRRGADAGPAGGRDARTRRPRGRFDLSGLPAPALPRTAGNLAAGRLCLGAPAVHALPQHSPAVLTAAGRWAIVGQRRPATRRWVPAGREGWK